MTTVKVSDLREEEVERALDELRRKERRSAVSVEFTGNGSPDAPALALVANALIAEPTALRVKVNDEKLVSAFPRLGLASALSRTEHERIAEPESLCNKQWGRRWTPGTRRASQAMFAGEPDGPGIFGPDYATFTDPHLTAPLSGSAALTSLVRRWLRRRLPDIGVSDLSTVRKTGFIHAQLLGNIREHAVTDDGPPLRSHVHVELRPADAKLVIAVVDGGPGIEKTLRRKLPDQGPAEPTELFDQLLKGKLPGWGRARGVGLSRCFEIVHQTPAASMLLATGRVRCHGHHDDDLKVSERSAVEGTAIAVTLPLG